MDQTIAMLAVFGSLQLTISAPSGNSALLYLSQYGYIGGPHGKLGNSSALLDATVYTRALKEFQSFAGLDITGELDRPTIEAMSLPRCGVKDKVGTGDNRAKRYALQGSRWKVKNLSYRIANYPNNLNKRDVDDEIYRAFSVWSIYTDLKFTQSSKGNVHIEIRFEEGEHGDGDPFDGPGGTLAHAYFPVFGGDAHFDASEKWTIGSYKGTNLFQVAAHEFGHSLGLSHSDVREALMAPFYRGYDPLFELHEDDKAGIQELYGVKKGTSNDNGHDDEDYDESKTTGRKQPPPPPSGPTDFSLCKDAKFDTIFNSADGHTYVFKGKKYWLLTSESIAPGYPKLISSGWPGLPGDIDAAFTYKNGKTYFFKGSQYWRYVRRKIDGDYPKNIAEGFTGIPDDLDASMVWSGNGKIYFFKGSKFWKFDPSQKPPVKSTYPKPLSNWEGLPNNLDAAFQWTNGYTYFYKDGAYYRFNDREFAVDRVNPEFPRSTAYWWFGCKDSPSGSVGSSESKGWLLDEESNNDTGEDLIDAGDHHEQTAEPNFLQGDKSGSRNNRVLLPITLMPMVMFLARLLNSAF